MYIRIKIIEISSCNNDCKKFMQVPKNIFSHTKKHTIIYDNTVFKK